MDRGIFKIAFELLFSPEGVEAEWKKIKCSTYAQTPSLSIFTLIPALTHCLNCKLSIFLEQSKVIDQ